MADTVLKEILAQYSKKKASVELEAEQRKQELYRNYPKLQQIDDKLASLAISTTKSLISNNDKKLLDELNKNIIELKQEKENFLKKSTSQVIILSPNMIVIYVRILDILLMMTILLLCVLA